MSGTVIVYNQGGVEELGRVSVQRAIHLVYKGKASILRAVEGAHFGPYDLPEAIELVRYIFAKWKYEFTGEVPFSKGAVLRRDNYTCCYCGGKANTVDHVLPKWQGNALTWNNAVAACQPCNHKKGGRSPKEAGMKMLFQPRTPTFSEAYKLRHSR